VIIHNYKENPSKKEEFSFLHLGDFIRRGKYIRLPLQQKTMTDLLTNQKKEL